MEKIAVLIAAYNAGAFLSDTVSAVLSQNYKNFFLYVVDDGSIDNTLEVLKNFEQDERVFVVSQPNSGQASALNRALHSSKAPLVAICDADDVWAPEHLGVLVSSHSERPDASFFCSDFCRGQDRTKPWVSAWQNLGYMDIEKPASFQALLSENFVCRSTVLCSRERLVELGGFSEQIGGKCGADDRDMWLRLTFKFGNAIRIPAVTVWKRDFADNGSKSLGFLESQVRLWEYWAEVEAIPTNDKKLIQANLAGKRLELAYSFRTRNLYRDGMRALVPLIKYPRHFKQTVLEASKLVICFSVFSVKSLIRLLRTRQYLS